MSESANTIEAQNFRRYKTVSLSEKTYRRLSLHAKGFESVDQTITRILFEREGKEAPDGERSF